MINKKDLDMGFFTTKQIGDFIKLFRDKYLYQANRIFLNDIRDLLEETKERTKNENK